MKRKNKTIIFIILIALTIGTVLTERDLVFSDENSLELLSKYNSQINVQAESRVLEVTDDKKHVPSIKSFNSDIKPVLERTCVKCHGPDKQKGDFRVDTLDPNFLQDWMGNTGKKYSIR